MMKKIYIGVLILLSFLWLVFAIRTNSYFSVDDFAILAYFKTHSVLQMIPDFLLHSDIYGFRRIVGFIAFGGLFEIFGVNHWAFDTSMFLVNTANLVVLFFIVQKITKNDFAAFFVSVIFNKNYLFYYSNIHELLLAFFCMLTIFLFLEFPKRFYLSVIAFLLALLTKETAVTVPLILLALSLLIKLNRKKILILLAVSFLYGVYALYFFIANKVAVPNFSYSVAPNAMDVLNGILFFVDWKVLILFAVLPLITKKYKYFPLLFAALITLIPASILVNRREMYYIYMPFSYLMIYLAPFLPKLSWKNSLVYLLIFLVLGGRNILPKIAWQIFPNWQKVAMEKVISMVENSLARKPDKAMISVRDINLERDGDLMLTSGDLDLFLDKNFSANYTFAYDKNSKIITATKI